VIGGDGDERVRGRGEDEEEVKKDAPSLGFFRGESGK
jgi:hypothetical protein